MRQIHADFSQPGGKVRPLHAVNNGPVYKFTEDQRITNLDAFREAKIPFARTHDAAFCNSYGGEHIVDVHMIFPDFARDPDDPAAYDFCLTDEYLRVMRFAGVTPFFRLGSKIEHWAKKYGTLPPKDNEKWARVCEHIIRHYTEGWADGFRWEMPYWEIWNEPDGAPDDADPVDKKCWGGTAAEFYEFFAVAAKHLKRCFPHLKIGGPATVCAATDWAEHFFAYLREQNVPLDFYSWHRYTADPRAIAEDARAARALLCRYGYREAESILNEWNYVKSFSGQDWIDSIRAEKGLRGAAFTAAVMCVASAVPVDMLMYYDARPCAMNGLFETDLVCNRLKGYYPFRMFGRLYTLGTEAACRAEGDDLFACAAMRAEGDGRGAAVLLTRYADEATDEADVALRLTSLPFGGPVRLRFYLLDEGHDEAAVREEYLSSPDGVVYLHLKNLDTYLVTVEPM